MYALDKNDKHVLRGETELVMACVFNPPVTGREVHGADGAYPLEEAVGANVTAFPAKEASP